MRWILWILAVLVVAGGAALAAFVFVVRGGLEEPEAVVMPQSPMPGRLVIGFQDDASFRWADDRAESLDRARDAGASVIRTIVVWATAAPERPADPTNPFDPAYELDEIDDLARNAQQRGIELVITIWGTPEWANGGQKPNTPPRDPEDLAAFAQVLADRYSGRHAGYPAVRLFSAWNEPNLEQFLAPQFDDAGRSVGPSLYAPIARAVYEGVKRGNADALVAIGETSPRGQDLPSRGPVQDSHSPPRFARLLSEERPSVPFDAWSQHPYPTSSEVAPTDRVRWPRVGLGNVERFGTALDEWFGREGTPIWLTEYGHETRPDPAGIDPEMQAEFAKAALAFAADNTRLRMFVWFILHDRPGTPWESGLIAEDGTPKTAFTRFTEAARTLDARNPVLPSDAESARLAALELAYDTPAGEPIEVSSHGWSLTAPLRPDGWVDVPLDTPAGGSLELRLTDPHGHFVTRVVRVESSSDLG